MTDFWHALILFGIPVAIVIGSLVVLFAWNPAKAKREPNAYSANGSYLIEHSPMPGKEPYVVCDMAAMGAALTGKVQPNSYRCRTRAEAEDFCRVLETGKPPAK